MIKIKILSVGKTKESWLEAAIFEYLKRLQNVVHFEFALTKDTPHLAALAEKEPLLLGLDPEGKLLSSEQFTDLFLQNVLQGGSRLTFLIGGPEGLPTYLKQKIPLLSLSRLTFTHQITRLILVEQIYRAMEIQKGSKYHK